MWVWEKGGPFGRLALAAFGGLAILGLCGCGFQLPTGMSPAFSLTGGDQAVHQASLEEPSRLEASTDEGVYLAPEVEYYCRGPDFDPDSECRAPRTSKSSEVADYSRIVVSGGDTLFSLARRHGTSADDLADLNGLEGTDIYPGQELELPATSNR